VLFGESFPKAVFSWKYRVFRLEAENMVGVAAWLTPWLTFFM